MEFDFEKEVAEFENVGSVVRQRILTTFESKIKIPPVSGYTENVRVENGKVYLKLGSD